MDVEYTVSQDAGGGRNAKQESDLQLAGISKLSQQAQQQQSEFLAGGNPPAQANSNARGHALADYQMQLMLLKPQERKRALMARQEGQHYQQDSFKFYEMNQQPELGSHATRELRERPYQQESADAPVSELFTMSSCNQGLDATKAQKRSASAAFDENLSAPDKLACRNAHSSPRTQSAADVRAQAFVR